MPHYYLGGITFPTTFGPIPPAFQQPPPPPPAPGHGHGHGGGHPRFFNVYDSDPANPLLIRPAFYTLYQHPELIWANPGLPMTSQRFDEARRALVILREFYRILKIRQQMSAYYWNPITSNYAGLFLAPLVANCVKHLQTYGPGEGTSPLLAPLIADFLTLFNTGVRLNTFIPLVPMGFSSYFNQYYTAAGAATPPTDADITQLYLLLYQRPPNELVGQSAGNSYVRQERHPTHTGGNYAHPVPGGQDLRYAANRANLVFVPY